MNNLKLVFALFCLMMTFALSAQTTMIKDYQINCHFETNQDVLTPHARLNLQQQLTKYLHQNIVSITLKGHTDQVGSKNQNQLLSQRRVQNIRFFLEENGFHSIRMKENYYGEDLPAIISHSNEVAENRRVEIFFLIEEIQAPKNIVYYPTKIDTFTIRHQAEIIPEVQVKRELTEFENFFHQLDKEAEIHLLQAKKGGFIHASNGTTLFFKKQSFCDCETKEEIKGEIEIKLKEYYKKSEFLQAGLHTVSMNRPLRTAGTFFIEALQNNKKVCLKDRVHFDIISPINKMSNTIYPDMNLFTGVKNKSGEIDWKVMGKNQLSNQQLLRLENQNSNDCRQCGGTTYQCIKFKFSARLNLFLFKYPQWRHYKKCRSKKGQARLERINAARNYKINMCLNKLEELLEKFKGNYPELVAAMKAEGLEMNDYVFDHYIGRSTQLNWINIDMFMKKEKGQKLVPLEIPITELDETIVRIVFKEDNSILNYNSSVNNYNNNQLPEGEPIEIIAIQYGKEEAKMATLSTEIGQKIEAEDFKFQNYTIDELKEVFNKLN